MSRIPIFSSLLAALSLLLANTTAQPQNPNMVSTNIPGVFSIAAPPQGFNPLTAKDVDLAYYGFPPRPDSSISPKGFAAWKRVMATSKIRITPKLEKTDIFHGPFNKVSSNDKSPIQFTPGGGGGSTYGSYNWSGYTTYSASGGYGTNASYYYIYATFVTPIAQQMPGACSGTDYGCSWVGIDGVYAPAATEVLQAGVEFDAYCNGGVTTPTYYAWYEWYPGAAVSIANFTIAPSNGIYMYLYPMSATTARLFMGNENTLQSVSLYVPAPTGVQWYGNSAEFITERPMVGGSLSTLTDYQDVPFWEAYAFTYSWVQYPLTAQNSHNILMWDNTCTHVISYPILIGDHAFFTEREGP